VAVVAVDPSSPITGGAVLGDRVRMQAYASDDGVFIRSMASRGHAGGLSSATTAAAAVFDAAGFDIVLIETVGTGQSEVEVAATADTTVVVEAPEMGDEIQAIKAGLLEVADIIVVNKGDRPGAHRTAGQLQAMLADAPREARPGRPAPKHPEVLVTTAATGEGVVELLAAIDRHRSVGRGELGESARLKRAEAQVWAVLVDRLHERVRALEGDSDEAATGEAKSAAGRLLLGVAAHDLDPYAAADAILSELMPDPRARRARARRLIAGSIAGGPLEPARRRRASPNDPNDGIDVERLGRSRMPRWVAKPSRSGLRTSPLMKTARLARSGRNSMAAS